MNRATPRPVSSPRRTGSGRRLAIVLALGAVAAAGFGWGQSGSSSPLAEAPARGHSRIRQERPPHPQRPYDVATAAMERHRALAQRPAPRLAPPPSSKPAPRSPKPAHEAAAAPARASGSSVPPASAGTNGSFAPPAASERASITPRTMAGVDQRPASQSAILLNGIALAPPGAPEAIKAAITAANTIVGRPYIWGGGHASWYSRGYDCSGAVSYALGGGGFISTPLTSTQLESFGVPGPGRWLTIYANAGHTYAVIAGLRWDTVGDARGSGPRWHAALPYPQGFVARHPPGY